MFRVIILSCLLSFAVGGLLPSGLRPIINGRIVGGNIVATIEEMPYQAEFLQFNIHRCGAAVINPTTAITAAHCLENVYPEWLTLMAGSVLRAKGDTMIKVIKYASHPLYDPDLINHDLAILWLETPLEFSDKIQPVKLPEFNAPVPAGTFGVLSGWGRKEEDSDEIVKVLRYVAVPVIEQQKCVEMSPDDLISEFMLCAGFEEGGKDACQQDSGGPFVIDNTLVGVVSWANGCARAHTPGVYARVASMRDWIDKAMAEELLS